jgi:hypothetical protein
VNPVLNLLITGAVTVFLVAFFAVVAYIAFRALRYKERNSGDFGGGPPVPPPYQPPPPQPPPRSSRSGRRQR